MATKAIDPVGLWWSKRKISSSVVHLLKKQNKKKMLRKHFDYCRVIYNLTFYRTHLVSLRYLGWMINLYSIAFLSGTRLEMCSRILKPGNASPFRKGTTFTYLKGFLGINMGFDHKHPNLQNMDSSLIDTVQVGKKAKTCSKYVIWMMDDMDVIFNMCLKCKHSTILLDAKHVHESC